MDRSRRLIRWVLTALPLAAVLPASAVFGAKLTLLDGRVLEGRVGAVAGIAESPDSPNPIAGDVSLTPILVIDDGLRRTYVSKRLVREVNEAATPAVERIHVPQRVASAGARVGSVGPIVRITNFDAYGRRIFTMQTDRGPLHIVQGITEVTPVYTKVEGLLGGRSYIWEMRVATSSIPRETLSKVLSGAVDASKPDARLKIVRLYLQSERYQDAREELESILADFPDLKELAGEVRAIRQMGARRLLQEIEMRASAGQHQFALRLLENFPSDNVAGETLQKVREIQAEYQQRIDRGRQAIALIDDNLAKVGDTELKRRLQRIRDEIREELSFDTLDRMAAFLRLADDENLEPEQKVALAVSGWLVGSNDAIENALSSLSLYEVRNLVAQYLREPLKAERVEILEQLREHEASAVPQVAKLLAMMKPPIDNEQVADKPGYYELRVPGLENDPETTYLVQLPPQYNPHRRYPLIVTLNGSGTTPDQQMDWWAGAFNEQGMRMGQASRHGYIVMAVDWQKPHQQTYQYSGREHNAVLSCLRDACRRFAVDTDRVFLSGHDIGGDAAWDLGLAHPDLWAGVVPVVAVADRYCTHYWENARYVPFYVIAGEMDGDKMNRNSRDLDRYLRRGYDTTVVEFLGRGHEHFHDEIQRLFDWMGRKQRDFYPKDFTCASMRTWDNYFWWVEVSEFPERVVLDPASWPPPRGTRPATVSGKVTGNTIYVRTATGRATVWLSPELVDFQQRISVSVNGRRLGREPFVDTDLTVLLEDVRTRGDRLHPFWARLDWPE